MSAIYVAIIRSADKYVPAKLRPFWNHPAGEKTLLFSYIIIILTKYFQSKVARNDAIFIH